MIFNKTEKQEKEYLRRLLEIVRRTINNTDVSVKEHIETLKEYKDYLWSNKDIDPQEIRSMRESILNHFALGESVIARRRRMDKLLDIPYFARIDFRENDPGKEVIPVYIGIHAFGDISTKTDLIYDWRSPVSGMFYDFEPGKASYPSPSGKVDGNISLKRQYRIRKGEMEYMIESSIAIHDEILQRELSSATDDKMRNVVATIQKEQNLIIRNEDTSTLIIQGVAGSGKTSIALHRIAYLLYTFKGKVSSKDILIISPNRVFSDYISNVLPELGEETIPETSMELILSGVLDNKFRYQSFFEQVNELLNKPGPDLIERINYKASLGFITKLESFILHIENTYFKATDVRLTKHFVIPSEFIDEQFRRFNRFPVRQRFEIMADYILETARVRYRISVTTAERNMLKKEIRNMFAGNNNLQLYKAFFELIGKPAMFKLRKNRTLEYSDLAPLAYLHIALEGNRSQPRVKHLLIDEMQDYSPVQYRVIQKLYPCNKTILGDIFQSVDPYGSSTADIIQKTFVTGKVMKLCKSYRSTYEIVELAQKVRLNNELEPVARHGEHPRIIGFGSREEELSGITALISSFKTTGYKSLGIICKTEALAKETSELLNTGPSDIHLLSRYSTAFVNGIVVTPAHVSKGLEFDEVIIIQADDSNYYSEIDRGMLYVGITRAMHRLTITYHGRLTGMLRQS